MFGLRPQMPQIKSPAPPGTPAGMMKEDASMKDPSEASPPATSQNTMGANATAANPARPNMPAANPTAMNARMPFMGGLPNQMTEQMKAAFMNRNLMARYPGGKPHPAD